MVTLLYMLINHPKCLQGANHHGGNWTRSSYLVALSEGSLWILDLTQVGQLPKTTTAADLASKADFGCWVKNRCNIGITMETMETI